MHSDSFRGSTAELYLYILFNLTLRFEMKYIDLAMLILPTIIDFLLRRSHCYKASCHLTTGHLVTIPSYNRPGKAIYAPPESCDYTSGAWQLACIYDCLQNPLVT